MSEQAPVNRFSLIKESRIRTLTDLKRASGRYFLKIFFVKRMVSLIKQSHTQFSTATSGGAKCGRNIFIAPSTIEFLIEELLEHVIAKSGDIVGPLRASDSTQLDCFVGLPQKQSQNETAILSLDFSNLNLTLITSIK